MFGIGWPSAAALHQLILCYFLNKNIQHVVLFNCWSVEENHQFAKTLMSANITTALPFTNLADNAQQFEVMPLIRMAYNASQLGVLLQYDCPLSDAVIEQCVEKKCFAMNFYWLILNYFGTEKITELLTNTDLRLDVEITIADIRNRQQRPDNQTLIPLYDIYNNGYHIGGKLNKTFDRFFIATENHHVSMSSDLRCLFTDSELGRHTKYVNRSNMSDVTFTFSAVVAETSLNQSNEVLVDYIAQTKDTQVDTYVRFGYQINLNLHDLMKYKFKYTFTDRWTYNDSSGGVFGEIIEDRAQLGVSFFLIFSKRLKYVRAIISAQKYFSYCSFFTPKYEDSIGDFYLRPFTSYVWYCTLGAIVSFALVLRFVYVVEKRKIDKSTPYVPSVVLTLLGSVGAICQQGSSIIPQTISGRIVHIMLFLTSVILYNYYTSEIVSVLIGSPVKSNIKTLKDLGNSRLICGIEDIPYIRTYLTLATDPGTQTFVKQKLEKEKHWNSSLLSLTPEEGYQRVQKGGYAYCTAASTGYFFIRKYFQPHEICDYNEITFMPPTHLGVYIKKDSAYGEVIKLHFTRMLETGVIDKHRKHFLPSRPQCLSNSVIMSVGLEHTVSVFLILAFGIALSFIIFLLEIAYKYSTRIDFAM